MDACMNAWVTAWVHGLYTTCTLVPSPHLPTHSLWPPQVWPLFL